MEYPSSDGGCVDLTKPSGLINPFGGTVVNNPSCPDLTGSAGG